MSDDPHLGTGWAFPVRWRSRGSERSPGVELVSGAEDVKEAIRILLQTHLRERVMRPDWGVGVDRYVFQPASRETCFRIAADVERAIVRWEPRAILERVEATPPGDDSARIDVRIDFRVDPHRRPDSLVFPFYLEGGEEP